MDAVAALLFFVGAVGYAGAGNPYCDNVPVFDPNGNPNNPSGGWGSWGATSNFQQGPCMQVSGLHVTQTYKKTVIIIDRSDSPATYMTRPNSNAPAFAEEVKLDSGAQRGLNVITDTFCSTGQFLPNGTLLSIGGFADGYSSVRAINPCDDNSCDFQLAGNIRATRWYPTSILLPNGRILIVGGSNSGAEINTPQKNVPSIEYWPKGPGEGTFYLQFLVDTLPYNLYPFVHLLPSGKVFIFAGQDWILFDTAKNQADNRNYPSLSTYDGQGSPIYRLYPNSGTSALFPLSSSNKWKAEIMICGGNSARAFAPYADSWVTADDKCYRIYPEDQNPKWTQETMCADGGCKSSYPRIMGNAVLLPDGNMLLINGMQVGRSGIPNHAHKPALRPIMYSTTAHSWTKDQLATSQVARGYHSSALLLHDGRVLITGNNPHNGIGYSGNGDYPTEFRSEIFSPPYFNNVKTYPRIWRYPYRITPATLFTVKFTAARQRGGKGLATRFSFVLAYPGFSTHGANHGMRNVKLDIKSITNRGRGVYQALVWTPPNKNVAPPTSYWLFCLDNGVPNRDGLNIILK